jgi:hypothetical protein
MSGEEDKMRLDVRRRRDNEIRYQERKITSHSMSGEEEEMRFDVSRRRHNKIRFEEKKIQ